LEITKEDRNYFPIELFENLNMGWVLRLNICYQVENHLGKHHEIDILGTLVFSSFSSFGMVETSSWKKIGSFLC
jgi:hypothetical protein